MPQRGAWYEDVVAAVARLLFPGTTVKERQHIDGPDGQREIDVEIRGLFDGKPRFIFLECKDLKEPVDVPKIDMLHSLSLDLKPDLAMIYSNSGFSRQALRKAGRLGLGAMSALRAGDNKIRWTVERLVVAKRLSVDDWSLVLSPSAASNLRFPSEWHPNELYYAELHVVNWLSDISGTLIQEYEDAHEIVCTFEFQKHASFTLSGVPVTLAGLQLRMSCSKTWFCQVVREDVTAGAFDHIRAHVIVPSGQAYILGLFAKDKWEPCEFNADEEHELGVGEFAVEIILSNPIAPVRPLAAPSIDQLLKPLVEVSIDGSVTRRIRPGFSSR